MNLINVSMSCPAKPLGFAPQLGIRGTLLSMSYRRGFQRVYVVCSVLWFVLVLVVSVLDRPKPRSEGFMVDQAMTDVEKMIADGLRTGKPVKVEDLGAAIRKQAPQLSGMGDVELVKSLGALNPHLRLNDLLIDAPDTGASPSAPTPAPVSAGAKTTPPISEDSGRYWRIRAAVTLMPPVVGYFILFLVAPWVYRGFM